MQLRRAKFRRQPQQLTSWTLTACDVAILAAIERYGLLPSSLLVRLVPFNEDVVYRHLRNLFDRELVNRFVLPRSVGPHGEFIYYLDNPKAIDVLVVRGGLAPETVDREAVWRNREKAYHEFLDPAKAAGRYSSLFYLDHELQLSRFHATLELACRKSAGSVELRAWRQGAALWRRVTLPKFVYDERRGRWFSEPETEVLPCRPDAFFALGFPGKPEGQQVAHFFYEADRGTMSAPRAMQRKFRAYFHFIVREKQHRQEYGIRRVRAVLVEAIDRNRARRLHQEAQHPTVCGGTPSPLFWFTTSEIFTHKEATTLRSRELPCYLEKPERVLEKIWVPAVEAPERCSLLD